MVDLNVLLALGWLSPQALSGWWAAEPRIPWMQSESCLTIKGLTSMDIARVHKGRFSSRSYSTWRKTEVEPKPAILFKGKSLSCWREPAIATIHVLLLTC